MATGDQQDMVGRLNAALPGGWFPDLSVAPILNVVLNGNASTWALMYSLVEYAEAQERLDTMTGFFLDLFAADFFGLSGLLRQSGELDSAYRLRIQAALFPPAVTRAAVISAATLACGSQASILVPRLTGDTGVTDNGTMAYDVAGAYGSNLMPGQFFVRAPITNGATPQAVCAAINAVKPSGRFVWVKFT